MLATNALGLLFRKMAPRKTWTRAWGDRTDSRKIEKYINNRVIIPGVFI